MCQRNLLLYVSRETNMIWNIFDYPFHVEQKCFSIKNPTKNP